MNLGKFRRMMLFAYIANIFNGISYMPNDNVRKPIKTYIVTKTPKQKKNRLTSKLATKERKKQRCLKKQRAA